MVIMFFFGYQKWFPYEFERLVPFISNGPLIWWLYPAFGHAGARLFPGHLGVDVPDLAARRLLGQAARLSSPAPSSRPSRSFRKAGTSMREASLRWTATSPS